MHGQKLVYSPDLNGPICLSLFVDSVSYSGVIFSSHKKLANNTFRFIYIYLNERTKKIKTTYNFTTEYFILPNFYWSENFVLKSK